MSFHKDLVGADLHGAKSTSAAGSPVGVVTPGVVGEHYFDTTGKNEWVAFGLGVNDWQLVGGGVAPPTGAAGGDLAGTYPNPTVALDAVTNTKLANMAQALIKGRASGAGTGDPQDLTAAQARTILNVADGANNYSHPNHTGDVTSLGDGAQTIANNAVTNAKAADMAANSVKANPTAGVADPQDLAMAASTILARLAAGNLKAATPTEVTALLNVFTSALKGLTPASGGGTANFLRADGTWVPPVAGHAFKQTPGTFSTTSTAPVVADTFAPGGGALTGTYRLGFRCEFSSDTAAADVEIELRRTDVGPTQIAYAEEEPADGDDWNTLAHFEYFVLAGATPTFDLRIEAVGTTTVSTRRIQWEWWRVA